MNIPGVMDKELAAARAEGLRFALNVIRDEASSRAAEGDLSYDAGQERLASRFWAQAFTLNGLIDTLEKKWIEQMSPTESSNTP